jgi:hypothetical protein
VLVTFAPSHIHSMDWAAPLFPIGVTAAGIGVLRHLEMGARVALSIAAAILASVLVAALVGCFGVPFHWAIGGKL